MISKKIVRLCYFLDDSPRHRLDSGDTLVVIGPRAETERLKRDLRNKLSIEALPKLKKSAGESLFVDRR